MKTLKLLLLFVVALSINAISQESTNVHVTTNGTNRVYVLMSSVVETPLNIQIYTENERLVHEFESTANLKSYKKLFNLKDLENGNYMVKVKAGKTTYKNQLKKTSDDITLLSRKVINEPYFSFSNDVIKLAFQNTEKKNVSLKIRKDGELYHQSDLGNKSILFAKYNLKNLEEGAYEVSLACNNQSYQYVVEK